jgi:hypothetical protein
MLQQNCQSVASSSIPLNSLVERVAVDNDIGESALLDSKSGTWLLSIARVASSELSVEESSLGVSREVCLLALRDAKTLLDGGGVFGGVLGAKGCLEREDTLDASSCGGRERGGDRLGVRLLLGDFAACLGAVDAVDDLRDLHGGRVAVLLALDGEAVALCAVTLGLALGLDLALGEAGATVGVDAEAGNVAGEVELDTVLLVDHGNKDCASAVGGARLVAGVEELNIREGRVGEFGVEGGGIWEQSLAAAVVAWACINDALEGVVAQVLDVVSGAVFVVKVLNRSNVWLVTKHGLAGGVTRNGLPGVWSCKCSAGHEGSEEAGLGRHVCGEEDGDRRSWWMRKDVLM